MEKVGDPTFMTFIYLVYIKRNFPYPMLVLVLVFFSALELVAFVVVNS